jgi:predicted nucleic acid-binding protein
VSVLLDTNVLIAQGNGEFTLFFEGLTTQRIVISVINRIELLAGPRLTEPQRSALVSLLDEFQEVGLTDEVVSMTIELLQCRQVKRLPDAIIAATALVTDSTLVTRNTIDFQRVTGLTLVDPSQA